MVSFTSGSLHSESTITVPPSAPSDRVLVYGAATNEGESLKTSTTATIKVVVPRNGGCPISVAKIV